jgi:DNA-binding transcriptional LysR family regulator
MVSQPTLRQLDYFVCAARLGTFAAAAADRHIAQPSLSEQIGVLERSIDVTLFNRTSRRLLLTDAGKQLLPYAERVLAEVEQFTEWGRGVKALEEGTVSFGTFNSAHLYLLTDLIREFHELHPTVRIRVVGLNSAEVADAVRSGELEAGIVQLPIDDRWRSTRLPLVRSYCRKPGGQRTIRCGSHSSLARSVQASCSTR